MSRRRKSKVARANIEPYKQCRPLYKNNVILGMEAIENRLQADADWEADSMAPIQLKESPVASTGWGTKTLVDDEPDADPVLYCPFCKWGDEEAGPGKQEYIFSRPDSLGRHVRAQHLRYRAADKGFNCPYQCVK
jgi:hypothetical protein